MKFTEEIHLNELQHHGILGQKWGIRNGPPYPLDQNTRSMSEKKSMAIDPKWVVNNMTVRKVAIGTLVGVAAVGAAYMAVKYDAFSKIRISDLPNYNTDFGVKFGSGDDGNRTGNMVFTPLTYQAMLNRYRDCAKNIDKVVFPNGERSLLKSYTDKDVEEMNDAVLTKIGKSMRQYSASGDLQAFAKALSKGEVSLDSSLTYKKMVLSINNHRELFEKAVKSGDDYGDLKAKEAAEILEIIKNLAEIYKDERNS